MKNYIVIKDLSKTYRADETAVNALKNISFSLPKTGMIFVIGKSGCGKSTLLNILGGLDKPTSGEVYIDGRKVDFSNEQALDAYRNEDIGFVFQDHNLIDNFNIEDNIKMSLTTQNRHVDSIEVDGILGLVDLDDCKAKMPNEVSGGQRQRVAIARTLIKNPKIMLADEPTGNLDSTNSKRVFEILKGLSKDNLILVVTHDLDSAYVYADRIIELKDGEIISDLVRTSDFDLNRLKNDYTREVNKAFVQNTSQVSIPVNTDDKKVDIKSKLSLKNAFHIMATWLKRGRLSILISIFILAFALGGFGLTNTITDYTYSKSLSKTLTDNGTGSVGLIKGSIDMQKYQLDFSEDTFSYDEFAEIKNEYRDVFLQQPISFTLDKFQDVQNIAYSNKIGGIVELDEDFLGSISGFYKSKMILGVSPNNNDDQLQIVISDYLADSILYYGTTFEEGVVYPNSPYLSLIGKTFVGDGIKYKIVGIYTSQYSDLYKQDYLKIEKNRDYVFARQFVYPMVLTSSGAIKNYALHSNAFKANMLLKMEDDEAYLEYSMGLYVAQDQFSVAAFLTRYNSKVVWAAGFDSQEIRDNDIILSFSQYLDIFDRYEYDGQILVSDIDHLTASDLTGLKVLEQTSTGEKEYFVRGVYGDVLGVQIGDVAIVSENTKNEHIESDLVIYSVVVSLLSNKASDIVRFASDNGMIVNSAATDRLLYYNGIFDVIKDVLNMVVVVLLLFVTILMYSVISKNIREKQKDIGILRSLGANRGDIAKILLLNDIFYIMSSFSLGVVIYGMGSITVNKLLCANLGLDLALLIINPISILYMLVVSVVVIIISSIIPIIRYTKMAPIDVIRDTNN